MTKEELSASTRNRHLTMLKSVFNKAVEWGMLFTNPCAAIKNIRENGARTRFLSTEEIDTLLAHASERFKPLLITALHTGMRRGEILRLMRSDVDFVNHIITVQESKSGKKRMIPVQTAIDHRLRRDRDKGCETVSSAAISSTLPSAR
jgi:integrase